MGERLGLIPVRDRTNQLVSLYGNYEKQIIAEMLKLNAANYTEIGAIQVQARIKNMLETLTKKAMKWSIVAVEDAYSLAGQKAVVSLNILGAGKSKDFNPKKHTYTEAEYSRKTSEDLLKANLSVMETVNAYIYYSRLAHNSINQEFQAYSEYGLTPADEIVIGDIISDTIEKELGVNEATRNINSFLQSRVIDGNLIMIKSRHYNLKDYSRMVARTRLRQAQTDSTLNYCDQYDNDLVQFSQHDSPCPECAPLEGQVFSISGRSKDYPILTDSDSPPIHPNCEHNLNPTSERAIRIRETFQ